LLCHHHHRLKTFHGYRLQHYKHRWIWLGPNDPPPDEDSDQPELITDDWLERANQFLGCG
jgi:hypothetical protein